MDIRVKIAGTSNEETGSAPATALHFFARTRQRYLKGIHPRPRQMLDKLTSWRRWSTADREPVEKWGNGRITLVGDADRAFARYESVHIPRTARIVWSVSRRVFPGSRLKPYPGYEARDLRRVVARTRRNAPPPGKPILPPFHPHPEALP